jgi:hypothetical protein
MADQLSRLNGTKPEPSKKRLEHFPFNYYTMKGAYYS